MMNYGKDVVIEKNVVIDVKDGFIGDRSIIRSGARIEGNKVYLGTESYLDHGALIGGGSCFDKEAYLNAGCWLHMGWNSQINIARGVDIGDEVGIGVETKIMTHGAYLPIDCGFPVQWGGVRIGNRVWLPHAWVNPGVMIEDNVVVAAMSLVNTNIPSGCLAGGIPAKVIKSNVYPAYAAESKSIKLDGAEFNITDRKIEGKATTKSEIFRNQLRRNGIRFKYYIKDGIYVPW